MESELYTRLLAAQGSSTIEDDETIEDLPDLVPAVQPTTGTPETKATVAQPGKPGGVTGAKQSTKKPRKQHTTPSGVAAATAYVLSGQTGKTSIPVPDIDPVRPQQAMVKTQIAELTQLVSTLAIEMKGMRTAHEAELRSMREESARVREHSQVQVSLGRGGFLPTTAYQETMSGFGSARVVDVFVNQALTKHCVFINSRTGCAEGIRQRELRLAIFYLIKGKSTRYKSIYANIYVGDIREVLARLSEVGVPSTPRLLHNLSQRLSKLKKTTRQSYPDFYEELEAVWLELEAIGHPETDQKKLTKLIMSMGEDTRYKPTVDRMLETPKLDINLCNDQFQLAAVEIKDNFSSRTQNNTSHTANLASHSESVEAEESQSGGGGRGRGRGRGRGGRG